jgi:ATP-binding cassette subfamily B protein
MRSLLRLLPYYRRHRVPFWAGIGLLLLARVFEALIPQLLKLGIDGIARGAAALAAIALGIALCTAARAGAIWLGRRAVRRLGLEVAWDLRHRLYENLQRQGPAFFARYRTGDLMARAINDIGVIRQLVAMGTRTVLVLVFSSAVALAFMLAESLSLTLLLLPPMPFVFGSALVLSRRLYGESMRVQEGFSALSDGVQQNLAGIRTIQALNQEEAEIGRFAACNDDYVARNLALVRTSSLLNSLMPAFGGLSILVVLFFGGARVLAGEISLGTFSAFLWYLNMVLWPVREAGNMINLFQRGAAGVARLFELLDHEPEIADGPVRGVPRRLRGEIEIAGLGYRYPDAEQPSLRDVSLRVAPGETLAILGRVGSGKSTLLRLLVRLLEAPPGSLRIDGVPIQDLPLADLRSQVALVPQEAFLFSDSVRANVSYDDPERGEEAVWEAIDCADLRDTVEAFPARLEAEVGERGVLLSGGQKQRMTLARSLIRGAPVLLLDDPFASVDSETEERIWKRIEELRRGKTTLLVTHRISTARSADRIAVLEGGRLVELGTPRELLRRDGLYAAMERAQRREELAEAAAGASGGPP